MGVFDVMIQIFRWINIRKIQVVLCFIVGVFGHCFEKYDLCFDFTSEEDIFDNLSNFLLVCFVKKINIKSIWITT